MTTMDRLTSYVRVFSGTDVSDLEERINEEIAERKGQVSALSITNGESGLYAIVSFDGAMPVLD